jgi:hypothetical protein
VPPNPPQARELARGAEATAHVLAALQRENGMLRKLLAEEKAQTARLAAERTAMLRRLMGETSEPRARSAQTVVSEPVERPAVEPEPSNLLSPFRPSRREEAKEEELSPEPVLGVPSGTIEELRTVQPATQVRSPPPRGRPLQLTLLPQPVSMALSSPRQLGATRPAYAAPQPYTASVPMAMGSPSYTQAPPPPPTTMAAMSPPPAYAPPMASPAFRSPPPPPASPMGSPRAPLVQ